MKTLQTLFRNNIREYGMLIALIVVMLFFQIETNGILFRPVNITNLVLQNSYVITMALGMGEALNPLQLLWINMVADIAPAMALALEPPERDVLKQPPRDPERPIINGADFRRLLRKRISAPLSLSSMK